MSALPGVRVESHHLRRHEPGQARHPNGAGMPTHNALLQAEQNSLTMTKKKPADIDGAHIFPFAYQDTWVLQGWPEYCSDRGPEGNCSHDYTGYHQICCLNNMIPLRADVHRLWDVYEIGVDIHDTNRIISFSKGRADLASCHLRVDHLPQQHRPLPALLTDHLSQGVYLRCLFPESQHASRRHVNDLGAVAEAFKTPLSPEDDDADVVELIDCVADCLTLKSDSSAGGKKEALDDLEQYDEIGHGPGKAAFEKYLEVALSDISHES